MSKHKLARITNPTTVKTMATTPFIRKNAEAPPLWSSGMREGFSRISVTVTDTPRVFVYTIVVVM